MSALAQIDPFDNRPALEAAERRGLVLEAEEKMLALAGEHGIEITPVHHLADGLYAREIVIPKGTLLTGKIHLREHLNIIPKGDISVMTEEGVKRVIGPAVLVSQPGIKRIGYAHEETTWITVHACAERDIEKIEEMLVVDSYEEFAARLKENPCLSLP